jgi:hypothetical protein
MFETKDFETASDDRLLLNLTSAGPSLFFHPSTYIPILYDNATDYIQKQAGEEIISYGNSGRRAHTATVAGNGGGSSGCGHA